MVGCHAIPYKGQGNAALHMSYVLKTTLFGALSVWIQSVVEKRIDLWFMRIFLLLCSVMVYNAIALMDIGVLQSLSSLGKHKTV